MKPKEISDIRKYSYYTGTLKQIFQKFSMFSVLTGPESVEIQNLKRPLQE